MVSYSLLQIVFIEYIVRNIVLALKARTASGVFTRLANPITIRENTMKRVRILIEELADILRVSDYLSKERKLSNYRHLILWSL